MLKAKKVLEPYHNPKNNSKGPKRTQNDPKIAQNLKARKQNEIYQSTHEEDSELFIQALRQPMNRLKRISKYEPKK